MAKKSCKLKGSCTACTPCGRRPCAAWQGPRSVLRLRRIVVTYRACLRRTAAAGALTVVLLVAGGLSGLWIPLGSAAAAVMLVWAATALRVLRLGLRCPPSDPGPGGAGVREPRRPRPHPSADAIGLPLPEDPQEGGAAAWA
ncbi:hypothetical protein [Streptomyces sp. NBC_00059]|uniref:hypothetical protein n=1 Tax=Streptomyces sp. NBC_00059 TaxID=2975635 RepID=UPI002258B53D|nr:hypothetical protein [Streptomyces sp. NBC_00059]MCX5418071.1 hypothetical protein [Streptomyces sp. NBC_00059]